MAGGVLRCLGTNLHLKGKFGSGFKVDVNFRGDADAVTAFVRRVLPTSAMESHHQHFLTFTVRAARVHAAASHWA